MGDPLAGADFFGLGDSAFTICLPKDALDSEYLPSNNDKGVSVMLRNGKMQVEGNLSDVKFNIHDIGDARFLH